MLKAHTRRTEIALDGDFLFCHGAQTLLTSALRCVSFHCSANTLSSVTFFSVAIDTGKSSPQQVATGLDYGPGLGVAWSWPGLATAGCPIDPKQFHRTPTADKAIP